MTRTIAMCFLFVGLTAAVLGACASPSATATPTGVRESAAPVLAPTTEAAPAGEATGAALAPAGETAAPTEPPAPKPVRTELEATDPTTVSLASGRPMLVEFFAFW
jgi:hypothetical protein